MDLLLIWGHVTTNSSGGWSQLDGKSPDYTVYHIGH